MRKKKLSVKRRASHLLLIPILGSMAAAPTYGATTDLSPTPLATSSDTLVKPNLMFIMDDSGSMSWTHVPDDIGDTLSEKNRNCYKNSVFNSLYFDPTKIYSPPKRADGTSFPDITFTNAPVNGYDTTSTKVNLSTSFRADIFMVAFVGDTTSSETTARSAYYLRYTAAGTPTPGVCYSDASYTLVDVNAGTAADKQNFANWFSYYRSRMLAMKTGVGLAFNNVTDKFRVGFTTINNTGTSDTSSEFLTIRDFDSTQKSSWYTKMYATSPGGGTPLRSALSKVGRIYAGKIGTDPVQYSCQQNFSLLSTDGFWNGAAGVRENGSTAIGNQDNDLATAPRPYFEGPGTKVTVTTVTTSNLFSLSTSGCSGGRRKRVFTTTTTTNKVVTNNGFEESNTTSTSTSGPTTDISCRSPAPSLPSPNPQVSTSTSTSSAPSTGMADTLADVAMYYYKTDLRPSTGTCNTGVSGADVCENNVPPSITDTVTHQHMTTFTLGLGINGLLKYRPDYDTATSGDFVDIKTGVKNWPVPEADDVTAVDDLWHAAVNGRGKYFSAKDPDSVLKGVSDVLAAAAAKIGAGSAAATSSLEPVAGDNFAYVAKYLTVKWDGELEARTLNPETGEVSLVPTWSAQGLLDARVSASADTRKIYMYKSSGATKLQDFIPANFTAAQKTAWFDATKLSHYTTLDATEKTAATSDSLINYLRGQSGNEGTLYRDRDHVLGDIVSGKPVYVKRTPLGYVDSGHADFRSDSGEAGKNRKGAVYVAANDGMLHAFEADTGQELWAYIPSMVLPNLYKLADENYGTNHQFYVDGAPIVGDFKDGSKWKTILVGGLNAGGRGYYALDITDPVNPQALWEFTDNNLGYTYGNPLLTKLKDGTWVVIFASGYNNVSPGDGVGRLFIVNAATGALIRTISTGVGSTTTPSGLAKISGWVDDGLTDNTTLRVYGGDLTGNLWRFDLNDILDPAGIDAFKLAEFKVAGAGQPITTSPELALVDGHAVVFVGTGRYLGASDLSDTSQQSLYAIKDKLDATSLGDARASTSCPLVRQDLSTISETERTTSSNPVDFASDCGWYMDFNPGNKSPGERVNIDPKLQLGVLVVATNVPEKSVCRAAGTSWLYFLDFQKGTFVEGSDRNVAGKLNANSVTVGITVIKTIDGKTVTIRTGSNAELSAVGNPRNLGPGSGVKRVNWREITED